MTYSTYVLVLLVTLVVVIMLMVTVVILKKAEHQEKNRNLHNAYLNSMSEESSVVYSRAKPTEYETNC
jgi:Co/Zn/Cd efflux system component